MLMLAEELLLFILDDEDGTMLPVPQRTLDFALAGAVLMDLALRDRIDSDPESIWISDNSPCGEVILDKLLQELSHVPLVSIENWIQVLAQHPGQLQDMALAQLVERGVLRQEEKRFLWMFETRRYPAKDGKEEREGQTFVSCRPCSARKFLTRGDIALICLIDSCNLFEDLLSRRELESVRERIALIRRLDLIGQATLRIVREIERVVTYMLPVVH